MSGVCRLAALKIGGVGAVALATAGRYAANRMLGAADVDELDLSDSYSIDQDVCQVLLEDVILNESLPRADRVLAAEYQHLMTDGLDAMAEVRANPELRRVLLLVAPKRMDPAMFGISGGDVVLELARALEL